MVGSTPWFRMRRLTQYFPVFIVLLGTACQRNGTSTPSPRGSNSSTPNTANTVGVISGVPSGPRLPSPAPLGNTTTLENQTVRFVGARPCSAISTTSTTNKTVTLAVELEVRNLGRTPVLVNPFYATLVDRDRLRYVTTLERCESPLLAQVLPAGQSIRGTVAFELPKSALHLILEYRPLTHQEPSIAARFEFDR
jgi:hypothetical protein